MDFLATSVTDTIRPFQDSDIEVRRRWYRVPWGTPTIGVPSVFMSAHYQAFPYLASGPGPVYPDTVSYTRRGTPDGLQFDHVCGTAEDFERGGVFDPSVNVVYDDEWIPECCGRESVCVTQLCGQDQVNGRPAAQLWSYPIPHQDADEFTPVMLQQEALNQGNTSPPSPGWLWSWMPGGDALDPVWNKVLIANNAGVLQSATETSRFAVDNAITEEHTSAGWSLAVEQGGVSGELTAAIVGGVLELCGTNAKLCADLLPDFVQQRLATGIIAAGTTQGTATAITTPTVQVVATNTAHGVRLPAGGGNLIAPPANGGIWWVVHVQSSAVATCKLYPAAGEQIDGLPTDDPLIIARGTAYLLVAHGGIFGGWSAIPYPEVGTGTVTAVSISTGSSGLTVGVTNPTTTPALTVDLSADLEQLVGFPSAAAIPVGDGAGNWDALTIGDFLNLSAGVLDVEPPGVSSGELVLGSFAITAAATVYQATTFTFTLPEAGTYLITGKIRGALQPLGAALARIVAKLYDTTAAADVPNTITSVVKSTALGQLVETTCGFTTVYTVAGASTIELYLARQGTNWAVSGIISDTDGYSVIDFARLY